VKGAAVGEEPRGGWDDHLISAGDRAVYVTVAVVIIVVTGLLAVVLF
jgi:hypothetical protein